MIFNCLKAVALRKECEDSLRRPKVEALDLWKIHWPNPDADIEEGWSEMARFQPLGKQVAGWYHGLAPLLLKQRRLLSAILGFHLTHSISS